MPSLSPYIWLFQSFISFIHKYAQTIKLSIDDIISCILQNTCYNDDRTYQGVFTWKKC